MRPIITWAMCAALMIGGGTALAFDEQTVPAAPAPGAASPNASPTLDVPILDLTSPDVDPTKGKTGTQIRLPGLGVIGEIPKMDFGLELLYGSSQPRQEESRDSEAEGLMFRGRLPLGSR